MTQMIAKTPYTGDPKSYEPAVAAYRRAAQEPDAVRAEIAELESAEKCAYEVYCTRTKRAGALIAGHGSFVAGPDPEAAAQWQRIKTRIEFLRASLVAVEKNATTFWGWPIPIDGGAQAGRL